MFRVVRLRTNLVANAALKWPFCTAFSSTRVPPIQPIRSASSDSSPSVDGVPGVSEEDLLPRYVPRVGESEPVKRARLLYQSRKRGMLENGLLLSTFASRYLDELDSEQLDQYDDLINRPSNDWQLYYWITGREETPARFDTNVMKLLKEHSRNDKKEERYRQPDLKPPQTSTTEPSSS